MGSDLTALAILERTLVRGWISVPEIVEELDLPATTALGVVQRLVIQGLLVRAADLPARRGRPVASYRPVIPEPAIACMIDGTEVMAAAVSERLEVGHVFCSESVESQQPDQLVERIRGVIGQAAADTDAGARVVLSINAVELAGRTLSSSVIPGISDILRRLMDQELGGRRVELCMSPMMLAEYRQFVAAGEACDPMLLLRVSDGVSSHAIIDRAVFHGASRLAGELGHVTVDPDGQLCGCGRRGCLETLCSGPALRRRFLAGLREGVVSSLSTRFVENASPRAVIGQAWQAWLAGDSFVRGAMEAVLDQIAWGAGLAVNLYDPQVVVVGGYVLKGRDAWIEEIFRRSQRWILHAGKRNDLRFVSARAGDEDLCQLIALLNFHGDLLGRRRNVAERARQSEADPMSELAQLLSVG